MRWPIEQQTVHIVFLKTRLVILRPSFSLFLLLYLFSLILTLKPNIVKTIMTFSEKCFFTLKLLLAWITKLLTRLPLPAAIPLYTLMMTISKYFAYDFGLVIDQLITNKGVIQSYKISWLFTIHKKIRNKT